MNNQVAIDMIEPGDVLVVDLFGMDENGTIVGDNLFYYIMQSAQRRLDSSSTARSAASKGISEHRRRRPTPATPSDGHWQRDADRHHVPVRSADLIVMPGDLVFGDVEGVDFIPPALVEPGCSTTRT